MTRSIPSQLADFRPSLLLAKGKFNCDGLKTEQDMSTKNYR